MLSTEPRITLLISCPDQPGIVAAVSSFILTYGGNIIESEQHSTDPHHGTFFLRVCFAEDSFTLDRAGLVTAFSPIAARFSMAWTVQYSSQRKRAALFVSKLDHCLIDLLWRWRSGELPLEIAMVIGNHAELAEIAAMYGVPFFHHAIRRESRAEDFAGIFARVQQDIDMVVLARFMQILPQDFIAAFPNRIINIHHSFLPAFVGAHPYQRAFDRGVKLIGATAHYVTAQLDEGPIIAQDVIHCNHRDTPHDLMRKGRDVERRVLAEAVRLHCEDRVLVFENKTIVFA